MRAFPLARCGFGNERRAVSEHEMSTNIRFIQAGGLPGEDDPATIHDCRRIGKAPCEVQIVFDQKVT